MCSTSSSANDLRKSQELGADLYITKTTTVKSFNKMIEEIFKRDWTVKKQKLFQEDWPFYMFSKAKRKMNFISIKINFGKIKNKSCGQFES
jgi:DNA-binding NarL/FixJ family response regulator